MEAIIAAVSALTQLYAKWLLAKAERGEKTAEAEAKWQDAVNLEMAKSHWQVEPDPTEED